MYSKSEYIPWSVIYHAGKRNSRKLFEYKPIVKNITKIVKEKIQKTSRIIPKRKEKKYDIVPYKKYVPLWNFNIKKKYDIVPYRKYIPVWNIYIENKKTDENKKVQNNIGNGSYYMNGFVCFQIK